MDPPDWDGALKAWGALEEKAPTAVERETMRLHAANVLIKQGKPDHARALLATVTEPALQKQKEKLVAELQPTVEK
jgi:outer membrane PBP1 activator LpoA protein